MQFSTRDKALIIQAETPAEVLEVIKHCRLDVLNHAAALAAGALTHTAEPGKRDNAEWFPVSASVGPEWFAPYAAKLAHWTGYTGPVPMIDAPRYPGGYCVNLCHTHIVTSAAMGSNGWVFHGFQCSQDWNGQAAAQRAPAYFKELCAEAIGDRKTEREFIEIGSGGLLKRNPDYLKRHAPHAAASSALVFDALLSWWEREHATPAQQHILARCLTNHRTVCKTDTLGAFLLRSYDHGYRLDWSGPLVSLDAFKVAA